MDYISYLRSMVGKERVIMVVAGAFVLDQENRLLLQLRSDSRTWGLPGGFMELGESVQETAKREVYEETGLELRKMELFGLYSGASHDKTFGNGDQVNLVEVVFTCHDYEGELITSNEESLENRFFPLDGLPALFADHEQVIHDFLSKKERPIIG